MATPARHCPRCPDRSLLATAGTVPWALLASANQRVWPSVPWAVPPTVLYLWLYWRYLGGAGWLRSTAEARRINRRANDLSGDVWGAALLAGTLGLVAVVLLVMVMGRLVALPQKQLPDLAPFPVVTLVCLLLTGAAVAGIVEEASFRGYMQRPIEQRHGPVVARHTGLASINPASSFVTSSSCRSSQRMWARMPRCSGGGAKPSRFFSATSISSSWRRRVSTASSSCAAALGSGRGVGRTRSAKSARIPFLVYPTVAPRPASVVGDGFAVWGLRFLYSADLPYTCFPSLHVAHAFVSALTCYRLHRAVGIAAVICAVLVALSTLFTKQHYVADVIPGYSWPSWPTPCCCARMHSGQSPRSIAASHLSLRWSSSASCSWASQSIGWHTDWGYRRDARGLPGTWSWRPSDK